MLAFISASVAARSDSATALQLGSVTSAGLSSLTPGGVLTSGTESRPHAGSATNKPSQALDPIEALLS
jgi:hypothetical protein